MARRRPIGAGASSRLRQARSAFLRSFTLIGSAFALFSRSLGAACSAALLAPLGGLVLLLRPAWRRGLSERLGRLPESAPGDSTWIHAASVGEVRAGLALAQRLQSQGSPVRVSASTWSGREAWKRALPGIPATLAPLDHPWCAARALAKARPRALVLIEGELWPSWIAAATRAGIPVVSLSARRSDRSGHGARRSTLLRLPLLARIGTSLQRRCYKRLAAIGARSQADARRLAAAGAPHATLRVTGDLKLVPAGPPPRVASDLRQALGGRPCWTAGSVHPEELSPLAQAWAHVRAELPEMMAIWAPRHPARAQPALASLEAAGLRPRWRSRLGVEPLAPDEVLVLDRIGELAACYSLAPVAFVGGSLVDRGGHNLAEPIAAGAVVLHGPHVSSVRELAACLSEAGAAVMVRDAASLGRELVRWLGQPECARAAAGRGRDVLAREASGTLERSVALLDSTLAGQPLPGTPWIDAGAAEGETQR